MVLITKRGRIIWVPFLFFLRLVGDKDENAVVFVIPLGGQQTLAPPHLTYDMKGGEGGK